MIVSINQPAFLPWLGYFHRIAISDLHIVLDHVQFEKNSYVNRNKIRMSDGSAWLTIPLVTSGRFGDLAINKVEISSNSNWQKKITQTIRQFYKKTPFFDEHFPFIEETFMSYQWTKMNDLVKHLNGYLLKVLDINTPLIYSSEVDTIGTKSDLVLNLCKQYNCTTYLSGPLGKNYLEEQKFEDNNIEVCYHEYTHPVYQQTYPGFVSHLSVIDLLFNCGRDSKNILMQPTKDAQLSA